MSEFSDTCAMCLLILIVMLLTFLLRTLTQPCSIIVNMNFKFLFSRKVLYVN